MERFTVIEMAKKLVASDTTGKLQIVQLSSQFDEIVLKKDFGCDGTGPDLYIKSYLDLIFDYFDWKKYSVLLRVEGDQAFLEYIIIDNKH